MTIVDDPAAPPPAKPKKNGKSKDVTIQTPCPPIAVAPAPPTMMDLIARAAADPTIDVAKLNALLDIRDREEERALKMADIEAEAAFNSAMAQVQSKLKRVAPDAKNDQTKSLYATYAAIDRVLKPIYTEAGFAISFNEEVGAVGPDIMRVLAYVTHTAPGAKRSHTRTYRIDVPADGKGARGGDVMTKTHAHGSATSYGKRYLLSMIFNLAVGKDDDGNAASGGTITADQAAELEALASEVGADLAKTCAHFEIEKISQLPADKFDRVKAGLENKRVPL
jgi:hypothetical protein